jgi:hypothetical protein
MSTNILSPPNFPSFEPDSFVRLFSGLSTKDLPKLQPPSRDGDYSMYVYNYALYIASVQAIRALARGAMADKDSKVAAHRAATFEAKINSVKCRVDADADPAFKQACIQRVRNGMSPSVASLSDEERAKRLKERKLAKNRRHKANRASRIAKKSLELATDHAAIIKTNRKIAGSSVTCYSDGTGSSVVTDGSGWSTVSRKRMTYAERLQATLKVHQNLNVAPKRVKNQIVVRQSDVDLNAANQYATAGFRDPVVRVISHLPVSANRS